MNPISLGILGTSEIAFRRFLPALTHCPSFQYAGVASRTPEKGEAFQSSFGGKIYPSYDHLLADDTIQAVYLPLPPALHYEWGKKALEAGKHLLMEKPFTTQPEHTQELLHLAQERQLAVHENYMFLYHQQLEQIQEMVTNGRLGEIRLYRMSFGFPHRGGNDFRYQKDLGGGALLDCGGYPIRLALNFLGPSARVVQSKLYQPEGYEVDLFGNAVLENDSGTVAQISFGMDNAYQCALEIWGSRATLLAPRIFTAGTDVVPSLSLKTSQGEHHLNLSPDDQFLHSIEQFAHSIEACQHSVSQNSFIHLQSLIIRQIESGSIS